MSPRDPLTEAYRLGRDTTAWHDVVPWWTDARLAWAAGAAWGAEQERRRIAAEADWAHRSAVRRSLTVVYTVDRRRAADAPGPRSGDWPGIDLCPGCGLQVCRCPSLEQVPAGRWRSDRQEATTHE